MIATSRMMQPSPRSQFHGNNAKVQRRPVTLSMSPPTFSMPRMPFLNRMRCTGSQSGKSSFQSRPPDHCLYSAARCGCSGPLRCGPMAVAKGWSLACVSWPTTFTCFSTNLAGRRDEAGRVAEIVLAVLVLLVPAGIDDHHVARAHHLARRLFQVVIVDRFPFLLRQRDLDAAAEEMRQRHLVDERRALHDMGRRVDVRGVVHAGRDALRQHARFRHVMDALDLDVFEVRPVRRLIAETMGEVVEGEPHGVVLVLLERDAANLLRYSRLPPSCGPPSCGGVRPLCTRIWYNCIELR